MFENIRAHICFHSFHKGEKKNAAELYKRASEIPDRDVTSSQSLSRRSSVSELSSESGNLGTRRASANQNKLDSVSEVERTST